MTFVGINRKWYEVTNRVSGNRATDGYIRDLGKALKLSPLEPKLDIIFQDIFQRHGLPYPLLVSKAIRIISASTLFLTS